ncbi:MAG: tryptophan synthase subunit alpha [Leptospiraceae bacterium]|nr:tryptophan synthase subunit alpha [Leptospiraceae bacterium]
MSSLEEVFQNRKHKSLFITYFSLGDPSYEASPRFAKAILSGGADILELGIPFSDPIADGPVIQKSYKRALDNSAFSMEQILNTTQEIHKLNTEVPIVYLSYLNPIMQFGMEEFFSKAYLSGVRGVVVPDIPFDAEDYLQVFEIAKKNSISIINLVTPATTKKRIHAIKKFSSGFIYYVTSYGVTGERKELDDSLGKRIAEVQAETKLPVCAGFGISTPEQAEKISQFADGVIIGSSIQKIIEANHTNLDNCEAELNRFVKEVRERME